MSQNSGDYTLVDTIRQARQQGGPLWEAIVQEVQTVFPNWTDYQNTRTELDAVKSRVGHIEEEDAELRQENARLRKGVVHLRLWQSQQMDRCSDVAKRQNVQHPEFAPAAICQQLEAKLAESRKDKERLDWMETQVDVQMWRNRNGGFSFVRDDEPSSFKHGDTFRAALDAAMKGESK